MFSPQMTQSEQRTGRSLGIGRSRAFPSQRFSASVSPEHRRIFHWRTIGLAGPIVLSLAVVACQTGGDQADPGPELTSRPSPESQGARVTTPLAPSYFPHGAVAADSPIASLAGAEILRAGGNAVDAAVATSFTLSVVRPQSCGIGGGGFMLIHLHDDPRHGTISTAINYRETCPEAYGPNFFVNDPDRDAPTHGGKAVAVPGTVAGLLYALEKYGTMDRATVLAPAIRAAHAGFKADKHYVDSAKEVLEWLNADASRPKRFPFLWNRILKHGEVKLGDLIQLPEQADALELIARDGLGAFYGGTIGNAVLQAVNGDGGTMTARDLAAFKVRETAPLTSKFMGKTLVMMPPPSSGGIVIAQALEILELRREQLSAAAPNGPEYVHLVTEALKHGFADRSRWMGDPEFVKVPTDALLAPAYIKARADLFDPARTLTHDCYGTAPADQPDAVLPEDHGTSHLSVIDAHGSAVACTETVNLIFGSLLPVPRYGFILNNEMDDFVTRPGAPNAFGLVESNRNLFQPGKRPLSSMAPMIGLDENGAMLVAGSSGGPRIITSTLEAALNVLVFDMSATEALARPRFHHQWQPDVLQLETPLVGTPTDAALRKLGHRTEAKAMIGAVQLIRRDRSGTGYDAASDQRKGGKPAGY